MSFTMFGWKFWRNEEWNVLISSMFTWTIISCTIFRRFLTNIFFIYTCLTLRTARDSMSRHPPIYLGKHRFYFEYFMYRCPPWGNFAHVLDILLINHYFGHLNCVAWMCFGNWKGGVPLCCWDLGSPRSGP